MQLIVIIQASFAVFYFVNFQKKFFFLGGNHSHDQCQSDEQMSQQSGHSILYNTQPQCAANSNLPSNTIKSSASGASSNKPNNTMNGSNCLLNSNTSNNGNIVNHHYEDLQMNSITGNLVPTSMVINNDNSLQSNNASAATVAGSTFSKTFRHVESSNDINDLTVPNETHIIVPGGKENGQEGRTNMAGIVLNDLSESHSSKGGGLKRTIGLTAINNNSNISQQSSFRSSSSSATTKAANLMRNSFKKAMGKT